MLKWLLIGGALFVAYLWYSNSSANKLASSAPKATPATNANSGFGVTVGVGTGGLSIKW